MSCTDMLGIDVSKHTLDSSLVDRASREPIWSNKLTNDADGIKLLLVKTDPNVPWVIEATGRYSTLVVKLATEAGRKVLLAPNRAAKLFLKSVSIRAKTDKIDGKGLGLFGLSRPLRQFTLKTEPVEHLDQLLAARKGLAASLQRARAQQSEFNFVADAFDKVISTLVEQIEDLDKRIEKQVSSDPAFELVKTLRQVPGIGPVSGAALGSRLSNKNFKRPDSFVAYIGLDLSVRQSGKSEGRVKLSKHGDAELRRLLYICAMAAVRVKNGVFKAEYERLKSKGRSSTEAFNIIARKLAHVCWALKKHGGPFDPAKVYAPRPAAESNTTVPEVSCDAPHLQS